MADPLISVLLPVRDAEDTLDECLDSIAAQRLRRFEVVLVDDGSTDASGSILRRRARGDTRLKVVEGEGRGLVSALNLGLQACRAPVIARMDADDRMHPNRLAAQLEAFDRWPGAAAIGTRVRLFPADRVTDGMRRYIDWQNACDSPRAMVDDIYLEAPFTHPSVALRACWLERLGGFRDGDFPEDYDLWLRLVAAGAPLRKLRATLLEWRVSPTSLSRRDGRYSREAFDRLRASHLVRDARLRGERPVVVWGAGRRTRRRVAHLAEGGVPVRAFIDIDPRKVGQSPGGVGVYPPVWLRAARPRPFVLVYVASHGARERIAAWLAGSGFERGVDWLQVG